MPPVGMPFVDDDDDDDGDDGDMVVDRHTNTPLITDIVINQELAKDAQQPVNEENRPVLGRDGIEDVDVDGDPDIKQEAVEVQAEGPGGDDDDESVGLFVDRYEWDD
jgi:hypothetical protein